MTKAETKIIKDIMKYNIENYGTNIDDLEAAMDDDRLYDDIYDVISTTDRYIDETADNGLTDKGNQTIARIMIAARPIIDDKIFEIEEAINAAQKAFLAI